MIKEYGQPFYLPIDGGRIVGFMPFPKWYANSILQNLNSVRWLHYSEDNHNTTSASINYFKPENCGIIMGDNVRYEQFKQFGSVWYVKVTVSYNVTATWFVGLGFTAYQPFNTKS